MAHYGKIYGKPRIKIGYGLSTGKVQRNIMQKTRFKLGDSKVRKFGFGK